MSNRRKPRRQVPLHGNPTTTRKPTLPFPLDAIEWTDQPPAQYTTQTLEWIAERHHERGRMNVWACEECGTEVLCFDLHPGVTPFMVSHHALGDADCPGMCRSHFYSGLSAAVARDRLGGPSHEWYRPSAGELSKADRHTREHVAQGGLLVRAVSS